MSQSDRQFIQHAREALQRSERIGPTSANIGEIRSAIRDVLTLAEHLVVRLERLERKDR